MMQLGEQESVLDTSMPLPLPLPPQDGANGGEEKGREGSGGGELDEDGGDKIGSGGSRWPRQETLALLKIRSDMDAVFRDSSLKGPLWEEVSRKLAGLGYHRSAKKCKEKFENVYKYHKRTKESRSAKPEGKTYRFFDQLQALEKQFSLSYPPQPQLQPQPPTPQPSLPTRPSDGTTVSHVTTTVPSTNLPPTIISPPQPPTNAVTTTTNAATTTTITCPTVVANPRNTSQAATAAATTPTNNNNVPYSLPNMNLFSSSNSTSSSTASDEDLEEKYRKKRKWKDYFRRLTRQVLSKQEEMQKRFLEAIDKREREQIAQQEAWRAQEMARINREHDLLVQERSTAAAKNAAVIAFLQKLSGQQSPITQPAGANFLPQTPQPQSQPQQSQQLPQLHLQLQPQQQQPQPLVLPPPVSKPQPPQQPHQQQLVPHPLASNNNMEIQSMSNGHNNGTPLSSSRWPKAEVHALIKIRTSLEAKYQENGPKAPLWEEISAAMQRIGYNRNAKRCKEKWENINKYFKKVKESNKQRREDSKTCPYFHELEALYKEKSKTQNLFGASIHNMRTNEMMEPLMVQPEQQWRPPPQYEESVKKNDETKEREQEEEEEDYDEEEGEGDSMEEDGGGNRYEIVTNKLSSVDTVE
ncbi:trihelix transcription factor DF1-like [Lotus japonicus]|uniref:trihelix transcription factor DF1-like n=1 Tax=Lotus japonicus TaxID=34305 RepID=UPI00258F61EB|nr:trihelix transcription factor DF1-like [Lotus japonicus]